MLPELWFWANAHVKLQLVWKQILIHYVALINSDVSLLIERRRGVNHSSLRRRQQFRTAVCPSDCLGYSQFCCFSCILNAICWTGERRLCNANFRVGVLTITWFQRTVWRCKIGWRAKLFSDLTVLQGNYHHHHNNRLLRFVGLVTLVHVSTTKYSSSGNYYT